MKNTCFQHELCDLALALIHTLQLITMIIKVEHIQLPTTRTTSHIKETPATTFKNALYQSLQGATWCNRPQQFATHAQHWLQRTATRIHFNNVQYQSLQSESISNIDHYHAEKHSTSTAIIIRVINRVILKNQSQFVAMGERVTSPRKQLKFFSMTLFNWVSEPHQRGTIATGTYYGA